MNEALDEGKKASFRIWLGLGLLSLALHLFLILPYGISRLLSTKKPLIADESRKEPSEIALSFVEPLVDIPPLPEKKPKQRPIAKKEKKKEPPIKKILETPKKPNIKLAESLPEKQPPKDPPSVHKKMVEQDVPDGEKNNENAKFLAEKNHFAKKETQAKKTNLEKHQKGPSPSADGSKASEKTASEEPKRTSVAGMRTAQASTETPSQSKQENEPKTTQVGLLPKGPLLSLGPLFPNGNDYRKIVGEDAVKAQEKEARDAKPSAPPSSWDRFAQKQQALKSAIENFTPGIEFGSESELGTRAHPFAKYIAAMHRRIHKQWAFRFLASIVHVGSYPEHALAKILIIVNEDGTLCKHQLVKTSGVVGYDTAAWSAVDRASPFPAPPLALRSPNGKTYVTWSFYRDQRQCATDFVDAHVVKKGEEPCTDVPSKALSQEQSEKENQTGSEEEAPKTPGISF